MGKEKLQKEYSEGTELRDKDLRLVAEVYMNMRAQNEKAQS